MNSLLNVNRKNRLNESGSGRQSLAMEGVTPVRCETRRLREPVRRHFISWRSPKMSKDEASPRSAAQFDLRPSRSQTQFRTARVRSRLTFRRGGWR
jgi:hypothetical protein